MKKRERLIVLFISLLVVFTSACAKNQEVDVASTFEGGSATMTEDQVYWVLSLQGSWQEMGRQYGKLAKEPLNSFFSEITADIEERGMSLEEQLNEAKNIAENLSPELNDLLTGMAETSGLTNDEVLLLNAGMINLTGTLISFDHADACSGIAAWDDYTPDGQLIFGRNWDIDRENMADYMKYLSVVVFHPEEGHAFANVHPLGNVYLETGMNDTGLFIELDNGEGSDPNFNPEAQDTASVLVDVLNQANTLDEATTMLMDTPADLSYIIQVADTDSSVSVERATQYPRIRTGVYDGLLVAYNNFIEPYPAEWEGFVNAPPDASIDPRYVNLIETANSETFYGNLDLEGMKELMALDVTEGGAVHGGTVFQYIAIPETKELYIHGIGYSDWQKVDLNEYFY
ncbi:C45 family peptidase [Eubacteriaceae bacterium ES3]|nr:C45 family peptidase [Eubacteriaceae bacterium ES3]